LYLTVYPLSCETHIFVIYTCRYVYVTVTKPPAAGGGTTAVSASEPVKQKTQVVVSRHDNNVVPPMATAVSTAAHSRPSPTTSPRRAVVDALFSTHLPPPPQPCDRHTARRSPPPPPRSCIEKPANRPASHTAPARPLARPEPELIAAAAATHSDLESLPIGFEMTTACPICQTPIPFDAASSDAFARHVDECISRVTSEGPTVGSRESVSTERTCPVCNMSCPADRFSQTDFERHVNEHFADDDVADSQQFEPLP